MSTTQDLVNALKSELRAAGVTYADLADALGMSESSVKRVFAKSDMPLSRIDEMLRVLKMDFAELARKVADAQPLSRQLTAEQEAAVVADRKLLLLAICCLSQWSFEAMTQRVRVQRRRVHQVPRPARPPRHHRAAPAQPLSAQGRQGVPLAAARPGDEATSASTSPPTT